MFSKSKFQLTSCPTLGSEWPANWVSWHNLWSSNTHQGKQRLRMGVCRTWQVGVESDAGGGWVGSEAKTGVFDLYLGSGSTGVELILFALELSGLGIRELCLYARHLLFIMMSHPRTNQLARPQGGTKGSPRHCVNRSKIPF